MDDRIRRDNSSNGENINSNSNPNERTQQWKFSENIDSNGPAEKINPTGQKVKRFEVHIPESANFADVRKPEGANRVPAPSSRPAPGTAQRRAVQNGNSSMPKRNPPAGRAASPEAQQAAKKAADNREKQSNKSIRAAEAKRRKELKKLEKKRMKRERRANLGYTLIKGILITCVCVIFVGTITTVVSSIAFSFINDVLVIDDDNKNYSVTVEIPEGATYDTIFDILVEKGLVSQPLMTDFFCRFRHYDAVNAYDEETGELLYDEVTGEALKVPVEYKPGVYYVYADSGIENILDSMLVYNDVNKDTVRLTFPEGFTIAEVFEKIEKYEVCEAEKLYANLDIVAGQYDSIKAITGSEGRYLKAEGYLFPDTYDFYIGESASSVIEKLMTNFEDKWTEEYDARLKELGMTKDQIITLASIIQSEAKDGSQMADISAVIHNRLKNQASYPTLDMDSTTDYVNSLKSFNVLTDVYYTLYIESYNTYSNQGLPPGPICNPGATAINAALYPSDASYYFFCHDKEGNAYFASTAAEHEANAQRVVYGVVGDSE